MPDANDNSFTIHAARVPPRRRSVLDLAPLELDCMNTLWPIGEGTVRDIRDRLAARRPRAYTTIMTIMDRLARKGIVERRKSGRAYIYRPHLTAEEARAQALGQLIDGFFSGSKEALLAQLEAPLAAAAPVAEPTPPRTLAAAASAAVISSAPSASAVSASAAPAASTSGAAQEPGAGLSAAIPPATSAVASSHEEAADRIDDTLL